MSSKSKKILFYIGAFGFFGAVLRHFIEAIKFLKFTWFPIATFLINICGTFLLTFFVNLAFEITDIKPELRVGIATGFFGAFTTFSTIFKEAFSLTAAQGMLYILASLTAGIISAFAGIITANNLIFRFLKEK